MRDSKRFNSNSYQWTKTPAYNKIFLNSQETYFNDLLKAKGYVFLNDVYKSLGIPETRFGQRMGWKYENKIKFNVKEKSDGEFELIFTNLKDILDVLPEY
jgi:hypothetical protein